MGPSMRARPVRLFTSTRRVGSDAHPIGDFFNAIGHKRQFRNVRDRSAYPSTAAALFGG
jgi:hypothetical protein